MSNLINLTAEAGAGIVGDEATPAVEFKNVSTGQALSLNGGVGNQTVAPLRIFGNSMASGVAIEFQGKGAFISITSVVLTTVANTDYAIPVQVGLETRYIPVYKAAAIIGGAAFS